MFLRVTFAITIENYLSLVNDQIRKKIFVDANLILVESVCLETVNNFLSLVTYMLIALRALNNNIFSVLF